MERSALEKTSSRIGSGSGGPFLPAPRRGAGRGREVTCCGPSACDRAWSALVSPATGSASQRLPHPPSPNLHLFTFFKIGLKKQLLARCRKARSTGRYSGLRSIGPTHVG